MTPERALLLLYLGGAFGTALRQLQSFLVEDWSNVPGPLTYVRALVVQTVLWPLFGLLIVLQLVFNIYTGEFP